MCVGTCVCMYVRLSLVSGVCECVRVCYVYLDVYNTVCLHMCGSFACVQTRLKYQMYLRRGLSAQESLNQERGLPIVKIVRILSCVVLSSDTMSDHVIWRLGET